MEGFINRNEELTLLAEAVDTLQDRQRLLRTPVVEFYGVEGIGKTTLLQKVASWCREKQLSYVWADAKKHPPQQFINEARVLVEKEEPVVAILDSLEAANEGQLHEIEDGLHDLVERNNLFVLLASRSIQRFEKTRSLARTLTARLLKPLKRDACLEFLGSYHSAITPEIRNAIFEWTRGYPLAMNVMTDAIVQDHLNPLEASGQQLLIQLIMQKVVQDKLLASVSAADFARFETLLSLFSVPRRFNLILMQDLINNFASQYSLENSMAYITLPSTINRAGGVLNWDLERSGYCIDGPVRNLFLLRYQFEQGQEYHAIHEFLAEKNKAYMQSVTGSDRIRYLREYLYHLAFSIADRASLRSIIEKQIEDIKRPDDFLQLYEEFLRDEELQEALGKDNASFAISLMRRNYIKVYCHLPAEDRRGSLKQFFSYTVSNVKTDDFSRIFEEGMRQIIKQESGANATKLYTELRDDEELRSMLEEHYEAVMARIEHDLQEG